jgi:hypothetical protein
LNFSETAWCHLNPMKVVSVMVVALQGNKISRALPNCMCREPPALSDNSSRQVPGTEHGRSFHSERTATLLVQMAYLDGSKDPNHTRVVILRWLARCKPQASQRVVRPIQKAGWHSVVLSKREPVPFIGNITIQVWYGADFKRFDNLFLNLCEVALFVFLLEARDLGQ